MVAPKGKGKVNASESKAKGSVLSDNSNPVTAMPESKEATGEEFLAVSGVGGVKENSNEEFEMEKDEIADEETREGDLNGEGSPEDAEQKENSTDTEKMETEEKEAAKKMDSKGSTGDPTSEQQEDKSNHVNAGKDNSTNGKELGDGGSVVAVESEAREENREANLTNETGEASKMSTDMQVGGITRKRVLKKLKKKVIKKKTVLGGKEGTQSESKLEPSAASEAAGKSDDLTTNEPVSQKVNLEIEPADKAKNLRKISKKKRVLQQENRKPATIDEKQEASEKNGTVKDKLVEGQDLKDSKEEEKRSNDVTKKSNKRRRLESVKADGDKGAIKGKDRAETSKGKKLKKKVDTRGMIFMCSSKTKKDCYRYKLMGLPASKKDMVLKIYKGMRLFLYDFDQRMLYGIYKAAGPGGVNIEPKAFNSQFPSQVRFTVLDDCVPVGEEKFRNVIKDNYYTRNKFSCELSAEQVKNLCILFQRAGHAKGKGKGSMPERTNRSLRLGASSSRKPERSTRGARDNVPRRRRDYERPAEGRRERAFVDGRRERRGGDEPRHGRLVMDDGYDQHPIIYRREDFVPVVAAPVALPPPAYAYGRTSAPEIYPQERAYEQLDRGALDVYRRDAALEHHDLRLSSLDTRRYVDEPEAREPYASYRQSVAYRDPVYSSAPGREYYDYPPAGTSAGYHLPARSAAYASEAAYRRY